MTDTAENTADNTKAKWAPPGPVLVKVEPAPPSFRDLKPKEQRDRMRAMYRDVQPEQPK